MSYARPSRYSDVYVYETVPVTGLLCMSCPLVIGDVLCWDPGVLIRRLLQHLEAGHRVPLYTFEALRYERRRLEHGGDA